MSQKIIEEIECVPIRDVDAYYDLSFKKWRSVNQKVTSRNSQPEDR